VSHHIICITACVQNVFLQHERKWYSLTPLTNSMFNNARPRAAHSLLHNFSSPTYDIKMNIIIVIYLINFQNDFVVSMIFWAYACATEYEFIVVNGQTTTSAFHKVV